MSAVSIRSIRKSFGPVTVLDGVDLDVAENSFTAILGPSGCGKTTLMRLIAGFLRPDHGSITIAGRTVSGPDTWVPTERRDIGYLAQEGALFPHLSIERNITFGLSRLERLAKARVLELMALVSLDPSYLAKFPHELSGGQQQRVALARALARRPRLVLLDEPFAALDADLRASTRSLVAKALAAEGVTTILVTHDQAEALSLADQIAVVHGGRVRQVGSAREVYESPVDLTTATITGETVVLPGSVADGVVTSELGAAPLGGVGNHSWRGPATVMLRPENLRLTSAPDAGGVQVEVTGIEYYGHDTLLKVATGTRTFAVRQMSAEAATIGMTARLLVDGAVQAYPVPGPTA